MLLFVLLPENLTDACAIFPSYYFGNYQYIRVLRVIKVFRLLKFLKFGRILNFLVETIHKSKKVLAFLSICMLCAILFFGCIMHLIEKGKYTVSEDFPNGAYIRNGLYGTPEVSPFASIFGSMYYSAITLMTVNS